MGKMAATITLGADPEFEVIVRGRVVSASDILGENIELPEGEIGVDGAGYPLELRPNPSETARGLVANVGRLLAAVPREARGLPSTIGEKYAIGGHLHIGFAGGAAPDYEEIARGLDRALGDIFYSLSSEARLKAGYGKRGDWRSQRWGVEYRTPPASIWAHPRAALVFVGATRWVARELLGGNNPLKSPALPKIRGAAKSAAAFVRRDGSRLHWGAWETFIGAEAPLACDGPAPIVKFDDGECDPTFINDMGAMCARLGIRSVRIIPLRWNRGDFASNVPGYGALAEGFSAFTPGGTLCLSWRFRNDAEFRRQELPKLEAAIAALLEPPPSDDDGGGRLIKEAVPLKLSSSAEGEPEAPEVEAEAEALEPEAEETYYCDRCGEALHREDAFVTDGGEGPYCEGCYYELYGRCARCNREVYISDVCEASNGHAYCEPCYYRLYAICAHCGEEIWRNSAFVMDGDTYCVPCSRTLGLSGAPEQALGNPGREPIVEV